MAVELFFNELSSPTLQIDESRARDLFKAFVGAVRAVAHINRNVVFNADISINTMPIGPEYSVATLRNHNSCVDESLFLKTLQSRSPFASAMEVLGATPDAYEYKLPAENPWEGRSAQGLGFAHMYGGLALSFESHAFWCQSHIRLLLLTMKSDAVELNTQQVSARNCWSADEALEHRTFLESLFSVPVDGDELLRRWSELLPNLRIIHRVREQLASFRKGNRAFQSAFARLVDIDRAVGDWREQLTDHPAWPCYVRPESQKRINQGLVTFRCDDDAQRVFSDHADFGPIEGRIHFRLETEPVRHALVGHVGRKLGIG